ncbi:phospholipase [Thermogemmatispora sp.]|jgi:hypothetical protein|uniref:phospholipase n=1 Tax=Thermogemmatispora sp. TaxID=1968838 RepID=UPI0035E444D3
MEASRSFFERVHSEPVVLEIGGEIGALILYTDPELRGKEIEVSPVQEPQKRTHTAVLERRLNGKQLFAAVFAALPAGLYTLWDLAGQPAGTVAIEGGRVNEINWCQSQRIAR